MKDTEEIINCPACGKEMKKIYIPDEKIYVDICLDGCGGIYFDNREFEKFDEQHENIDVILNAMKDKTFKYVDTTQPRICPVCKTPMVKHYMSVLHEVEIDECYGCGAKFLDNGELQKIRSQFVNNEERSKAMMEYLQQNFANEYMEIQKETNQMTYHRKSFLMRVIQSFIN